MWRNAFNAPWPDNANLLPAPVQAQAAREIRYYWQAHGWQLVLGEVILWAAAAHHSAPLAAGYGALALLIGLAYASGFMLSSFSWILVSSTLFLIQGMVIRGLGPVTALTFIMPYTFAGILLSERQRMIAQAWCMVGFWVGLLYSGVPARFQLDPPTYLLVSYDILLAAFAFQTLRFLNHLTVKINSAFVTGEIRGQSQQFLARVSHELRTPLNSVLGFAKLLRRAELTEAERGYLKQIVEEGEHLNRLVSDLLDSAQLSSGKMTLQREACDLNALCRSLAEEQRPTLNTCIRLITDFAAGLPEAQADGVRLRQAISNLLSNAVKYTPRGEICLRTYRRDSWICVEVRDSGPGIPAEQHGLIFAPFVQLDGRQAGAGLGLDIALQIARLHGGDIQVISAPGQGSSFILTLPLNLP